jgi:hypothetical protein
MRCMGVCILRSGVRCMVVVILRGLRLVGPGRLGRRKAARCADRGTNADRNEQKQEQERMAGTVHHGRLGAA